MDKYALTLEEINKLAEFNDLLIKPLVYLMALGIRLGALDYLKWKHIIPTKSEDDDSVLV